MALWCYQAVPQLITFVRDPVTKTGTYFPKLLDGATGSVVLRWVLCYGLQYMELSHSKKRLYCTELFYGATGSVVLSRCMAVPALEEQNIEAIAAMLTGFLFPYPLLTPSPVLTESPYAISAGRATSLQRPRFASPGTQLLLLAYARATRCPGFSRRAFVPLVHAITPMFDLLSEVQVCYPPTRFLPAVRYRRSVQGPVSGTDGAMVLPMYAIPGTDLGYGTATIGYAATRLCDVRLLSGCARCGTDRCYSAIRRESRATERRPKPPFATGHCLSPYASAMPSPELT
eukprot:1095313-Rhodomonas_salina.2